MIISAVQIYGIHFIVLSVYIWEYALSLFMFSKKTDILIMFTWFLIKKKREKMHENKRMFKKSSVVCW